MRAAVLDVNFILSEDARVCGHCAQALSDSPSPAIGDIRASAQRDVSTWLKQTIS